MPTSGSINFNLTAGDVITRAFRLIRKLGQNDTVPAELSATGLTVLNVLIKGWQTRGALLSSLTQGTPISVTGAQSYALSPRALAVLNVRYKPTNGNEVPMDEITRTEYMEIPTKTSTARPCQYFVDRQRATTTLYVWGVGTSGAGTIPYDYKRILEDLDATTDDFDVSQEYLETVIYGLADRLIDEFADASTVNAQRISARASILEADMFADSRPTEYVFVPDTR